MFVTKLAVEYLDGGRRRLLRRLVYECWDGRRIEVPAGFVTDFFSIPRPLRWLIRRDRKGREAAVVHDLLCRYRYPEFPAVDTHRIFREALHDAGVNRFMRWLFWAAVHHFGPGGW